MRLDRATSWHAAAIGIVLLAAAPAPPPPITPGYWEVTSAATTMDIPGVPRFVTALARRPSTAKRCVTPEQASHLLIQQYGDRQNCTMLQNRMADGIVDLSALCPEKNGAQTRVRVTGSYTPVSYAVSGEILGTGGPKGDLRIDFTENGRRLGDCPAGKSG